MDRDERRECGWLTSEERDQAAAIEAAEFGPVSRPDETSIEFYLQGSTPQERSYDLFGPTSEERFNMGDRP